MGKLDFRGINTMIGYTIFTGRFAPTFKETAEKIPYLLDLGVNTVWMTPWVESTSYHGYDATSYYKVDPRFGTMEEFTEMMKEFNDAGIRVIMDLVLCHTSNEHPWFSTKPQFYYVEHQVEKPKDDCLPDIKFGACWHKKNDEKDVWYRAPFWSGMPALNLDNKELREEIRSIVAFWLTKGVSGFRLDAVGHSHPDRAKSVEFWNWFRQEVRLLSPEAFLVGEAWEEHKEVARYSNALGSCFNFDTASAIIESVKTQKINQTVFNIKKINDDMKWARHYDSLFLSNHDQDRVGYHLDSLEKKKVAASLLMTLKGIPFMYYGEELGWDTNMKPTDENVRQKMVWHRACLHQLDDNSLYNHYKNLIKVRKNSKALSHGNLIPIKMDNEKISAFCRSFYNEEVVVIINLGEEAYIPWGVDKYKQLYQSDGVSHKRKDDNSLYVPKGTTILERV